MLLAISPRLAPFAMQIMIITNSQSTDLKGNNFRRPINLQSFVVAALMLLKGGGGGFSGNSQGAKFPGVRMALNSSVQLLALPAVHNHGSSISRVVRSDTPPEG